jgi:hypothetical protein
MAKIRTHNEFFQPLSPSYKKKCPNCRANTQVWAWGQYISCARWQLVKHFCRFCFDKEVKTPLLAHINPCGCIINLMARSGHGPLPEWISLENYY